MNASQPGGDADPGSAQTVEPEVASSMHQLLLSVGAEEYDPQVVDLLTDFVYTYSKDILKDAQAYGEAAGQPVGTVDLRDVELAIRSRTDMSFAGAPSLQMLTETAESMNRRDLPAIEGKRGVPLPGSQALLAPNVQYTGWDANRQSAEAAGVGTRPPANSGGISAPTVSADDANGLPMAD